MRCLFQWKIKRIIESFQAFSSIKPFDSLLFLLHLSKLFSKHSHFVLKRQMWRFPSSSRFLFRSALCVTSRVQVEHPIRLWGGHPFCTSPPQDPEPNPSTNTKESMSFAEAKRLMRLADVEALKRKLGTETEETIKYSELLDACEELGVAKTREEAVAFAKVLDDAGVILLFRDKVYLHPNKVVDLVRRAVPLALTPENDPRREELKQLMKKKEEIDMLAHKQARRVLWSGLGFFVVQISLFFRLTFWEFSWDVMEPIAFFGTTAGILLGYAYFLFTSRDPTYQDLMKRLFVSRQKKLYQKKGFNLDRYLELQNHCKCPWDRDGESEFHRIDEKEKLT